MKTFLALFLSTTFLCTSAFGGNMTRYDGESVDYKTATENLWEPSDRSFEKTSMSMMIWGLVIAAAIATGAALSANNQ